MHKIEQILKLNMKIFGAPELVNKNNLDSNFYYDNDKINIVKNANSYFIIEPKKWSMPAKNYFVRICLAYYLHNKFNKDFLELMNVNSILPYDDQFSPLYNDDKETYDAILSTIKDKRISDMYGYKKTIKVFGYLYATILKPITIGYNGDGQDFFDLISFKKKHIWEYYFSLYHKMRQMKLNPDKELEALVSCDTYGIPGNLLLNTPDEDKECIELIKKVNKSIKLQSVSVLTLDAAKKIRKEFPGLLIHLSTHGAFNVKPEEYSYGLIDILNVSEPWYLKQTEIINAAKENNVKIKYIVNRGCIINKWENMSALLKECVHCNDFGMSNGTGGSLVGCEHKCKQIVEKYPWFSLAYINIQKEFLAFNKDIDIVKISTRDNPLDEIKHLLDYWTSYKPSEKIVNIPIYNYEAYIDYVRTKATVCKGICIECMKCIDFYNKITRGIS